MSANSQIKLLLKQQEGDTIDIKQQVNNLSWWDFTIHTECKDLDFDIGTIRVESIEVYHDNCTFTLIVKGYINF